MQPVIDLANSDLYGAFSGLEPPATPIDFGHGIVLSKTYAHFFQSPLMAFEPAPAASHHPGGWAVVRGGNSCDIHCQLFVPKTFALTPFFDRLNTIWWIAALLRLRGGYDCFIPAVSTGPFTKDLADGDKYRIIAIPTEARHWSIGAPTKDAIDIVYAWVKAHWQTGGSLMGQSESFNTLARALDSSLTRPTAQLALIEIWGGLDQLFAESPGEVRYKNSMRIASFLEPFGKARRNLFDSILALYDKRSKAAHGGQADLVGALGESHALARRVITTVIERKSVPTRADLAIATLGE